MRGIEGGWHGELETHGVRTKHQWHVGGLVIADAVLATERAADVDDALHESLADEFHLLQFTRNTRIEEKIRMQIAIACMEDIHRADIRGIGFIIDKLKHLGQRPLRDYSVLDDISGTKLPQQSACRFARLPQFFAKCILIAEHHIIRACMTQKLGDGLHASMHECLRTIDLHQQHERTLGQSASHLTALHHGHATWVEHLNGSRIRRVCHQRMNRRLGRFQIGIGRAKGPYFFRQWQQSQPEARESRQRALGADHESLPILAPRPATTRRATETMQAAIQHNRLDSEHIVARHAVAKTMRATRVRRHIATQRANRTARGIRRIKHAMRLQCGIEIIERHTAFDLTPKALQIDLPNLLQSRGMNNHAALRRHRSTRKRSACSTHHQRHPQPPRALHEDGELFGIRWNHHRIRKVAFITEAIRTVARKLRCRGQHTPARQQRFELVFERKNHRSSYR